MMSWIKRNKNLGVIESLARSPFQAPLRPLKKTKWLKRMRHGTLVTVRSLEVVSILQWLSVLTPRAACFQASGAKMTVVILIARGLDLGGY